MSAEWFKDVQVVQRQQPPAEKPIRYRIIDMMARTVDGKHQVKAPKKHRNNLSYLYQEAATRKLRMRTEANGQWLYMWWERTKPKASR